jgi:hypothetical protein
VILPSRNGTDGSAWRVPLLASTLLAFAAAAGVSGCRPEIGDKCIISTDCSTRGDRLCDTSQPSGYCTQFNCKKDSCPDEAACVLFNAAVPGCGYDDRAGPYGSRVARSFCVASCETNEDCRSGYVCADPREAPFDGRVLDTNQNRRTCLVAASELEIDAGPPVSRPPAPICGTTKPDVGAIDASAPRVGVDAGTEPPLVPEAGPGDLDAGDAGDDASDGG